MISKKFKNEYEKLNSKQKEAVDAIEGSVMVIAGPGTGKTQILAMRIANILLKTQINPSNILCLTFTNTGAQAMKQRLLEIVGTQSYQIQINTFHAFCNEVIDQFPEKFLKAKNINQLDELEEVFIIQRILKNNDYKFIKPFKSQYYYQKAIIRAISQLKQENITPKEFNKVLDREKLSYNTGNFDLSKSDKYDLESRLNKNFELCDVYKRYQGYLENEGKYDYDDMVLLVLNALQKDKELLSYYQEKFQYILVDEYQDTNNSQNKITELLGSFYKNPNIFVVGDDEQSIYRFCGASMENILEFKKKYPASKIIVLDKNYRSNQKILDASRELIQHNKNQIFNRLKINKKLLSQRKNIGKLSLGEFSSESSENFFIATKIKELITREKIPPQNIAVLYRENRDADELVEYLANLKIPFKLEVGENILDDPEIHKIIKFLKIVHLNNAKVDNEIIFEVMHYPFFKLSLLDIYKISLECRKQKKNIFEILASNLKTYKLEREIAVKKFLKLILECRNYFCNNNFSEAFNFVLDRTGYISYLVDQKKDPRYLNRLQTLFKYIQRQNIKDKNLNLGKFLEHLTLLEENGIKIKEELISSDFAGVNLLTAHKAKGLEFEVVFIIHLTNGRWGNKKERELIKLPSSLLKIQKQVDVNDEEERRLFYVALTRAKSKIYLTYALNYGDQDSPTFAIPSKFISELPNNLLERINSALIESDYQTRLKLRFAKTNFVKTKSFNDFLKTLIDAYKLSPTSLNAYLDCPQRFFYDNILRVPKAKNFSQCYGTAVHFALEKFFKQYKKDFILPNKNNLITWFNEGLEQEILDSNDYKRAITQGSSILKKYYDHYLAQWKKHGPPISCEFNFDYHNVHFNSIAITGRIDKIELMDSISRKVRIIDYKTTSAKSLNFLLGKTKEKNTTFLYQAYFYKLLSENDPLFNWKIGEIVFDFIADSGFKQMVIPIDNKEFEKFKILVQEIYQKIIKLEFTTNYAACINRNGKCDYLGVCKKIK